MRCSELGMRLYAVTGGSSTLPLREQLAEALAGGATFIQLRIKDATTSELTEEARRLLPLCRKANVPFVIDDDVQAALDSGADGVHVGQSDMALSEARRLLGPDRIVGVSAHTVEEALAAEKGGADYLGVGAMFATSTKPDAELVSADMLRKICQAVKIPVTAIGGIGLENMKDLSGTECNGVAVVSAIFSRPDIRKAAEELRSEADRIFGKDPVRITVLADNRAAEGFLSEHGLSLQLEYRKQTLLFDTGAGQAFPENASRLGIDPHSFQTVILSHGHDDHTGGLCALSDSVRLFHAPGVRTARVSLHPGRLPHALGMPNACVRKMQNVDAEEITSFHDIGNGCFLSGPIPRPSGEDTGGKFFLDEACTRPDSVADEQALLLAGGILIQGCCHAGIINTLRFCREQHPEIPVRCIAGGLHLMNADETRLRRTVQAIRESDVRTLVLMHCTGESAVEYLKQNLPECRILMPRAGETFTLTGE